MAFLQLRSPLFSGPLPFEPVDPFADLNINVFEDITITESSTVVVSDPQINVSDTITLTENVTLTPPDFGTVSISVSDSITVTDTPFIRFAISALFDDFDDNNLDATKWDDWGGGNTNETNGQFEITTNSTSGYFGLNSVRDFDLTSSYALVELVSAGNQALVSLGLGLVIEDPDLSGNEQLCIIVEGGTIYFRRRAGGANSDTTDTYNSTTDRWFRIRESAGTVYFDTSADSITWTNRRTSTSPFDNLADVTISLFAGTWQNEGSTSLVIFDNLNIPTTKINVSDTATITESIKIEQESRINVSDSITVTEAKNLALVHTINETENITVTDSIYALQIFKKYTSQEVNILPTTDADLTTEFTQQNYTDVATSDNTRVTV